MAKPSPITITALTEVYGSGQKITAIAIQYPVEIDEAMVSLRAFDVEGLTITGAYVSNAPRGEVRRQGCYVILTLDTAQARNTTLEHTGHGPHTRLVVQPPRVSVSQLHTLKAVTGAELPPFQRQEATQMDNGVLDQFVMQTFRTADGRQLDYQMYAINRCLPGHKYPLVLFMHDAGSCCDNPLAPLVQGNGAVVWARDALFLRRPCFVVAPHYPEVCANDEFEVGWQGAATVQLVRQLTQSYPIDEARIYGTGQSMGCMMLCEMMLQNPGFFAGCLLVAGQWSPERMRAAKHENLWAVVSAGDEKAYPIMGEALRHMEQGGGRLSRGHLDAKADASVLDAQIRRQKARCCNLNFTWFEGASILPPGMPDSSGMHHVHTWGKAYDIKALREWLFEQRAPVKEENRGSD